MRRRQRSPPPSRHLPFVPHFLQLARCLPLKPSSFASGSRCLDSANKMIKQATTHSPPKSRDFLPSPFPLCHRWKNCRFPFQTQMNPNEKSGEARFTSSSPKSDPSCSCSSSARQCTPATRCCPAPTSRAPSSRSRSSRPGRRGLLDARLRNCGFRYTVSISDPHGKNDTEEKQGKDKHKKKKKKKKKK